jgi:chaperonin GroES
VLIQPLEKKGESKTASGFILPGKEGNEKQERGTVVAVGPGRMSAEGKRIPIDVATGAIVIFKRGYDTEELSLGNDDLLLVSESNLLGIEEK